MIAERYDAIIVGGGPAGLACALNLARAGIKPVVLEKKQEFGSPIRCGEMTRQDFAEAGGFARQPEFIRNDYGPVVLLARDRLEMGLAEMVVRAGGAVFCRARARTLIPHDGRAIGVVVDHEETTRRVSAPVLVAADGIESGIARQAGMNVFLELRNTAACYSAKLENVQVDPRFPNLDYRFGGTPKYFYWIFPITSSSANVGVGVAGTQGREVRRIFTEFISQTPALTNGCPTRVLTGVVPITTPLDKPYGDGLLVIGTAARLVDPQGGEGVIYALASGKAAADVIREARADNDFSASRLAVYRERLGNMYGFIGQSYQNLLRRLAQ